MALVNLQKNLKKIFQNKYIMNTKTIFYLIPFLSLNWGCNLASRETNKSNDGDTTYEVIRTLKGDTSIITPIVNGKKNGISKGYYDNGAIRTTNTYMDDRLHGERISYTRDGRIAEKEIWANSSLKEKIVFLQKDPMDNEKYTFISAEGIHVYKDGQYIQDFGDNPPEGLIIQIPELGKGDVLYIIRNGKLVLY